jgi:hypothetical protein
VHSYLGKLLHHAYESIPGELYNQYRRDVTERLADTHLFYEVSLLEEKSWEFLRDQIFPFFVRYLRAKLVDPEHASGVVVAIFHKDRCHLIQGKDFLTAFGEIERLDGRELHDKVQQWLSDS